MKNLIVGILIVAVVGGVCVYFFYPDLFEKAKNQVKGYTPAKTPKEAVDKFREAISKRDYSAAKVYCDGPFLTQLNDEKFREEATKLANMIKSTLEVMDDLGIKSKKAEYFLLYHHPFPTEIKFRDVVEKDGKASVIVYVDAPEVLKYAAQNPGFEPRMLNVMVQKINPRGTKIEIRKVGEGDDASWKLVFPAIPDPSIDYFKERASNFTNAIGHVKDASKTDPSIKKVDGFENELQQSLLNAAKE